MNKTLKNKIAVSLLVVIFALLLGSAFVANNTANATETTYYVCLSTQNYAVRAANMLTVAADGTYRLEDISLSDTTLFYITDNGGSRWYGADNEEMQVEESGTYNYDIRFSPTQTYTAEAVDGTDWQATNCHITYMFHTPAAYSVYVNGVEQPLVFNPYQTNYDLYYISSISLSENDVISLTAVPEEGDETYTVRLSGKYRVLFTPKLTENGNEYAFDENGVYGSGEDYSHELYVEDAPTYVVRYDGTEVYCSLTRYEKNTSTVQYVSESFFVPNTDYDLRYVIYEYYQDTDKYKAIDDDNDEDTAVSEIMVTDVGWYSLYFTDGGNIFLFKVYK